MKIKTDSLSDRAKLNLHRRQFVIGPEQIKYRPDWKIIELENELFLSHCSNLPVKSTTDADGNVWHIIGIAVQTEPNRPDPAEEIAGTTTAEVPSRYHSWSGRWMLIGNQELHLDAVGSLGCYYLKNTNSSCHHKAWISSSPALLAELTGDKVGYEDPHELRHGVGIEWYPLPRTRFSCMTHLLPSQILQLPEGTILKRSLLQYKYSNLSYEQILDKLEINLLTFFNRLPFEGHRVWLAMTSGLDTRLLSAIIMKAKIPVRTYTQEYKKMVLGDRLLPEKISTIMGLEHVFVRTARFDKQKAALYDAHVRGFHLDFNRDFWARGQWNFAEEGDLLLRGLCFEVGRYRYRDKLPDPDLPSPERLLQVFGETNVSTMKGGFTEWIDWVKQTPHEHLDWQDRFHIEQRLAGWLSAGMLTWDMTGLEHLNPISSANAFELLLKVPPELRARGQHQIDIIRRIAPELLKVPINPPGEYFDFMTKLYWHWSEDIFFPIKYIRKRLGRKSKNK